MWTEISRYLPEFSSAVLTGFDNIDRPFSLRVRPTLDANLQVIRFGLPTGQFLLAGKACLLCHRHDQNLWNLKSFVVLGTLERSESGWLLRPSRFIPGVGIGGMSSYLRFVLDGRKNTSRYLEKRGMPRPTIDWDQIMDMMAPVEHGS